MLPDIGDPLDSAGGGAPRRRRSRWWPAAALLLLAIAATLGYRLVFGETPPSYRTAAVALAWDQSPWLAIWPHFFQVTP